MVKEQGLWIAFEGNDGSGKSTMIDAVGDYLEDLSLGVVKTREPGGNPYSEELRRLIFNNEVAKDGETQLLLFTAARRRNIIDVVIPAKSKGLIVLSDRSEWSTRAYQHYQFGIPMEEIEYVNGLATKGIKPDYTFLLDVDIETGISRTKIAKGESANHFDIAKKEDMAKRRFGYLSMVQKYPDLIYINANNDGVTVFKDIIKAFRDHKILEAYGL